MPPIASSTVKRFINRRGKPEQIFSNCRKNFIGTTNELKIAIDKKRTQIQQKKGSYGILTQLLLHILVVTGATCQNSKEYDIQQDMGSTVLPEFQVSIEVEEIVNNPSHTCRWTWTTQFDSSPDRQIQWQGSYQGKWWGYIKL